MQEKIDNKMVGKSDNKCEESELKKKRKKEFEEAEVVEEGDEE